ncbi:ATP-binding protein [Lentzea sp. NPDC058450]|uniref:ATP-binding protein n=1 Tax=Lentzea sp. NPDC058450 TaxID=3346505 RepID=UPI0036587081
MRITERSAVLVHQDFLALRFPADAREVGPVRHRLRDWLKDSGLGDDEASDLVLAVSEAINNSVEHAYPGSGGTVAVHARVEPDGSTRVDVSDRGQWRTPPPALTMRGRGLLLMRESVDEVEIDRRANGTTVRLRLTPSSVAKPPPALSPECDVRVHESSSGVVAVICGDVPMEAAPSLRRTLTTAARGGTVPLIVDLSGVGRERGGVELALQDVAEALRQAGNRLRVSSEPRPPTSAG